MDLNGKGERMDWWNNGGRMEEWKNGLVEANTVRGENFLN